MKKLNKKNTSKKWETPYRQAGMTYVELIVVLAIFAIMVSVVLFNYRDFQARVEVKSLSNDIASKIVGAQKSAMSGQLAPLIQQNIQGEWGVTNWKPSYGLYFSEKTPGSFISFADLDNSAFLSGGINPAYNKNDSTCDGRECLDQININQNYQISDLNVSYEDCSGGETNTLEAKVDTISIAFTRPDSKAVIQTTPVVGCPISFASINLTSINNGANKANILIYSSGRMELQ